MKKVQSMIYGFVLSEGEGMLPSFFFFSSRKERDDTFNKVFKDGYYDWEGPVGLGRRYNVHMLQKLNSHKFRYYQKEGDIIG